MENTKKATVAFRVLYSMAQMLYWSSCFTTLGFAAAYLGGIGFSNSSIGLIVSSSGLIGFVLMLFVSVAIDKADNGLLFIIIEVTLFVQILLVGALFYSRHTGILPTILNVFFLAIEQALNSMLSKLYINLEKQGADIDFGKARGFGSLAYAGASFLIGFHISHYPSIYVHLLTLLFYVLLLITVFFIKKMKTRLSSADISVSATSGRMSYGARSFTKEYKFFLILAFGVSLVTACNRTFSTFLVNLVFDLGGNVRTYTMLTGILAILEIPVMMVFTNLRRKWSLKTLLILSLLLAALTFVGSALAHSLPMLYSSQLFHVFSTGLFFPAVVEYIRETIPFRDTAKCQSIIDGAPVFVSLITMCGIGKLLDFYTAQKVCIILFALSLIGSYITWIALRNDEQQ